jgi:hypothetical protein
VNKVGGAATIMGKRKGAYRVLVGKPATGNLKDLYADRRIILIWI